MFKHTVHPHVLIIAQLQLYLITNIDLELEINYDFVKFTTGSC